MSAVKADVGTILATIREWVDSYWIMRFEQNNYSMLKSGKWGNAAEVVTMQWHKKGESRRGEQMVRDFATASMSLQNNHCEPNLFVDNE